MEITIRLLSSIMCVWLLMSAMGCGSDPAPLSPTDVSSKPIATEQVTASVPTVESSVSSQEDASLVSQAPASAPASTPSSPSSASKPAGSTVSKIPAVYQNILDTLVQLYPWTWEKLEEKPFSYMYVFTDDLSDIDYAVQDVIGDSQPELILSNRGSILNMYTINDGKADCMFSTWDHGWYYVLTNRKICSIGSDNADFSYWELCDLQDGELKKIDSVVYDRIQADEMGEEFDYFLKNEGTPVSWKEAEAYMEKWGEERTDFSYTSLADWAR